MSEHHYGLRMRQSLAQFERAFTSESIEDQRRREQIELTVRRRARARTRERANRRSSMRFYALMFSLAATAVVVTVVMLATLYLLLV